MRKLLVTLDNHSRIVDAIGEINICYHPEGGVMVIVADNLHYEGYSWRSMWADTIQFL